LRPPSQNRSHAGPSTPAMPDADKVATLHEAIQDLLTLQHGGTVPHC